MNEREISERAIDGDTEAWEQLIHLYNRRLYAYFYGRNFYSIFEPRDLTQETWIRAFKGIKNYDPDQGNFSGWLLGIARYVLIDEIKEQQKTVSMEELGADEYATDEKYLYVAEMVLQGNEITDSVEEKELITMVHNAVDSLPDLYKEPFMLYYFEDFTHSEVTGRLGISIDTSKVRVYRAMVKVKQYLRDLLHGELGVI